MTDQHHVYAHFTADTNELFYIGMGGKKRVTQRTGTQRNKVWHEIVDKHGFESEIIISFDNKEEALAEELRLQIVNEPRACLWYGSGAGRTVSQTTKDKLSKAKSGFKHTEKSRRKISEAGKGNTNTLGHKLTIEHRKKISDTREKKSVINCRGERFSSITEAAKHFNLKCRCSISRCMNEHHSYYKTAGRYPDGSKVTWSWA
ncbi:hypothetical protein KAR91_82885 [Candidatus Pacearchaeota archaeon]|nr:hypothetical protein [Candidatus Pacearchaeota archaeon]